MNVAFVGSVTTAVVGALFAALTWVLAGAPGLRSLRVFSACSLCGAVYACLMAAQATGDASAGRFALRFVIVLNALHASLWLYYSCLREGRGLFRYEKAIVAVAMAFGVVGLVPGVMYEGAPWYHSIGWLGVRYYDARSTWLGDLAFVYMLAVLVLVTVRSIRRFRRGDGLGGGETVGVVAMLAAAVSDSLVSSEWLELPYVLDVGYLVLVIAVSHDLARKFILDAKNLRAAESALVRTARLAALGQMAEVVADEVRAPVASIGVSVGHLRTEGADATSRFDAIQADAERLNRMVADLLELARPRALRLDDVDAMLVANGAIDVFRGSRVGGDVPVTLDAPAALPAVRLDASLMRHAFLNLLLSAAQVDAARSLTLVVRVEGADLVVRVVAEGTVAVVDEGADVGLALPVARRIARDHGGDVVAGTWRGRRASVLRVPLEASDEVPSPRIAEDDHGGGAGASRVRSDGPP